MSRLAQIIQFNPKDKYYGNKNSKQIHKTLDKTNKFIELFTNNVRTFCDPSSISVTHMRCENKLLFAGKLQLPPSLGSCSTRSRFQINLLKRFSFSLFAAKLSRSLNSCFHTDFDTAGAQLCLCFDRETLMNGIEVVCLIYAGVTWVRGQFGF